MNQYNQFFCTGLQFTREYNGLANTPCSWRVIIGRKNGVYYVGGRLSKYHTKLENYEGIMAEKN